MRGDSLAVGLLLGLLAPAIGLLLYALLIVSSVRSEMTLRYFLEEMIFGMKRNIAPALSISLFADVGLFFLFDRKGWNRAMRGVIGALFLWGIVIVISISLWAGELLS